MEGCLGWQRRRRVERRGSGKKGWERARKENELQKKEKMVSARDGGWHHSAESDLGGGEGHIIRWSEVSALEDDDDLKERCLHSSRKLCSRLREEWGEWWIIIICARCYPEFCTGAGNITSHGFGEIALLICVLLPAVGEPNAY